LRDLLDACAVVREFDEAALATISGDEDIRAPFAELARLSVVRPALHGLMIHDDVRRILAGDLRWRRPERYRDLRLRALAYYSERMATAATDEREWLLAERLYLHGDALVQRVFFTEAEPGEFWVELARPEDRDELLVLWSWAVRNVLATLLHFERERDPLSDRAFLEQIFSSPGTIIWVARHRDGPIIGFFSHIPVCQETLPLLETNALVGPLISACWGPDELARLPATSQETTIFYSGYGCHGDFMPEAVMAALWRQYAQLFARGGIYLINTPIPAYQAALEGLGF